MIGKYFPRSKETLMHDSVVVAVHQIVRRGILKLTWLDLVAICLILLDTFTWMQILY